MKTVVYCRIQTILLPIKTIRVKLGMTSIRFLITRIMGAKDTTLHLIMACDTTAMMLMTSCLHQTKQASKHKDIATQKQPNGMITTMIKTMTSIPMNFKTITLTMALIMRNTRTLTEIATIITHKKRQ